MKTILRSQELTCPSCIGKIEKVLGRVEGVENATVHFATGRIDIDHDPDRVASGDLVDAVRRAGYESHVAPY